MAESWIGAERWDDGQVERLPPGRRLVVVICCRGCDSVDVGKRDSDAGDAVAFWQCRACGMRWKEPVSAGGGGKATLA